MSSRSRHSPVPLIKYDFNRATDRRREPRREWKEELYYFRDTTVGDVRTGFSSKIHDKN